MLTCLDKCYEDHDKRRPVPPSPGMTLGYGSGKELSEWVRLHMALNSHPPKSTYIQLSKPTHIVWRCTGINCPWYLTVKRRSREEEWYVAEFRDMHIQCDGVCKPTAKDLEIIIPELLSSNASLEVVNQYLSDRGFAALTVGKMYRARREAQGMHPTKRLKTNEEPEDLIQNVESVEHEI